MPSRPKAPETPALLHVQPEVVVALGFDASRGTAALTSVTEGLVRLYPTHTAYIPDEPAIEREVTREEADRLLAYKPPAFTTEPPPEAEDDLPEASHPTDAVDEPQE